MKFGISFGAFTRAFAREFDCIKGVAVDSSELFTLGTENMLKKYEGFDICHVGAFLVNPLHPDRSHVESTLSKLEKAIPLTKDIGCHTILVSAGNYDPSTYYNCHVDTFRPEAMDRVARAYEPICKIAEKYNVNITIEPHIYTVVNTPEKFIELKNKIGSSAFMVNCEICNFYTLDSLFEPTEHVEHITSVLKGHYKIAHLKDMALKPGFHLHIDEVEFGTGATDWKAALKILNQDMPKDGYIVLEHAHSWEYGVTGYNNFMNIVNEIGLDLE